MRKASIFSLLVFAFLLLCLCYFLYFCCCCCIASVASDSVRPHRRQPTRLPRPWDSPGKNTGVGCHCLLQCMRGKSEREVAQSCSTLNRPHGLQPTRLLCPWDFPGKSTEVGCHCLLLLINTLIYFKKINFLAYQSFLPPPRYSFPSINGWSNLKILQKLFR